MILPASTSESPEMIRLCPKFIKWVRSRPALQVALLLALVCATYGNHFQNSFHFDDSHTVVDNPSIRSLANVPRFFSDATTFSVLPANRTYRPMVSASLALDYALAGGYKPFWFQLSTFVVYLAQLVAMYVFFLAILKTCRLDPGAIEIDCIAALLATAWYGLHPAIAETINYIIQRGDVYCAFGVVTALALYAQFPEIRKTGLYLLTFVFALLSKPPAVVFPVLLFLYLVLFEQEGKGKYLRSFVNCIPAIAVCGGLMVFESFMTPKTYAPSILSATSYRITQPFVLMRYFGALFLPIHLNADTDLQAFSSVNADALIGFVFVGLVLAVAFFTARSQRMRPIAFGLFWFVIASLPTSLYALSEVENDHRMFLPFVGLVLAVVWAGVLGVEALAAKASNRHLPISASLAGACLLLGVYAYAAHARNRVWRTEESLWLDDVRKSPHNGRGWMNYGLTQMSKGAYPEALESFQRALIYTPNYQTLEINLGIVLGAMHRDVEAAQHFQRAIALAPADDQTHFFYARWLYTSGDVSRAVPELKIAAELNPSKLDTRELLAEAYRALGEADKARSTAADILRISPSDPGAARLLQQQPAPTADFWINASLYQYKSGNYQACIDAAREALKLKPNSALAYNNIGAAYAGLRQWDLAIQNEHEALRIDPNFAVALNNLALYTSLSAAARQMPKTADDWLNASLRDNQTGQYRKSIADAESALRLRPDYAEAYNNIAAAYEAQGDWDRAIAAALKAVRLKPDFQLAKNNLAWAQSQKKLRSH